MSKKHEFTHSGVITNHGYGSPTKRRVQLRETKQHWIDSQGIKWKKRGGGRVGAARWDSDTLQVDTIVTALEGDRAQLVDNITALELEAELARTAVRGADERLEIAVKRVSIALAALSEFDATHQACESAAREILRGTP